MKLVCAVAKWSLPSLLSVVLTLLLWTNLTRASHNFTDIPDSPAVFHNAVEWIKNRMITSGCTTTEYCPNSSVTRLQMALFMQRLGGVLTPTTVGSGVGPMGVIDLDASPVVCPTTADHVPPWPQVALMLIRVSVQATPASDFADVGILPVFSTDGGVTWNVTEGNPFPAAVTAFSPQGGYVSVTHLGGVNLTPPTGYRFAIRLQRLAGSTGTSDLSTVHCNTVALIFNRNPAASPLSPQSGGR